MHEEWAYKSDLRKRVLVILKVILNFDNYPSLLKCWSGLRYPIKILPHILTKEKKKYINAHYLPPFPSPHDSLAQGSSIFFFFFLHNPKKHMEKPPTPSYVFKLTFKIPSCNFKRLQRI